MSWNSLEKLINLATSEIPLLVRTPKVHWRVQKSLPLDRILNQLIHFTSLGPTSLRSILVDQPITPKSSVSSMKFFE